jgi:hypothetical protein
MSFNPADNFPKDDNGNVKPGPGRPEGTGFRDAIAKLGAELVEIEGRKLTKTEASVLASFKLAMEGDTTAIKFLATHLEGSKVDNTSNGETITPIQIYIPANGRDNTD